MPTEQRDMMNVSIEQMQTACRKYREGGATEEQAQLIEWAYHYCCTELERSKSRLADAVGYHEQNLWKLFMGTYEGSIDNVCDALESARIRALTIVSTGFVETPVTRKIWEACDYAARMNAMVVIRGQTGRSKTIAAREWCRRNNHGRAVYYECEENTTYARLLAGVAGAMSISRNRTSAMYRHSIERQVSRRNTIVIDEAGHLCSARRSDTRAFDFLRAIHDARHCGVVLIFTDYYWDLVTTGKMSGFFEQFLGRIAYQLAVPQDTIFAGEVNAVCRAFCERPDDLMLREAAKIASGNDGKIRTLFQHLQNASTYARGKNESLSGKHLRMARIWRDTGGDWSQLTTV